MILKFNLMMKMMEIKNKLKERRKKTSFSFKDQLYSFVMTCMLRL